jgi:hypothetical protein
LDGSGCGLRARGREGDRLAGAPCADRQARGARHRQTDTYGDTQTLGSTEAGRARPPGVTSWPARALIGTGEPRAP